VKTLVKTGMVFIGGEITTSAWVDMEQIARGRDTRHWLQQL